MKKTQCFSHGWCNHTCCWCLSCLLCSKSGSSNTNTNFTYVYQTDPETLDYTLSSKTSTHEITSNVIDGLLENDQYGNLVPSLAEDWSVSRTGLTYTYKLRKGVKWYTSDGEEYADVTAKDFGDRFETCCR